MFTPYKPWKVVLTCLACFLWMRPLTSTAQTPSSKPGAYINDLAGVLNKTDIHTLDEQIHTLEKKYSVQLAVILVDKLPDGASIEEYAGGIGRKWHVGIHDSGLVYVASISERRQRLEVSSALNKVISDKDAHDITDNIKPFFRSKDYKGGIGGMIGDITGHFRAAVEGHDSSAATQAQSDQTSSANTPSVDLSIPGQSPGWDWGNMVVFGIFAIFIVTVIGAAFRGVRRTRRSRDTNLIHNSIHMSDSSYRSSQLDYTGMVTDAGTAILIDQAVRTDHSPHSHPSDSSNTDTSSPSSSDFGNWGGSDAGSSDSGFSSSDPGFSGGGSSNDW